MHNESTVNKIAVTEREDSQARLVLDQIEN